MPTAPNLPDDQPSGNYTPRASGMKSRFAEWAGHEVQEPSGEVMGHDPTPKQARFHQPKLKHETGAGDLPPCPPRPAGL